MCNAFVHYIRALYPCTPWISQIWLDMSATDKCVPAGEVDQEGVGEGASSCTPGSLYSYTHQHLTFGLEGRCSCSKVAGVGKHN